MGDFFFRLKNLNWFLIFLTFFLTFVGMVMIFSATSGKGFDILVSHVSKVFLGFSLMLIIGTIQIDFWKKYGFYLYFLGLILLFWASFYGYLGKGSRRWISLFGFNFQPSELMKILIIVALAKFFDEKKIQEAKDYFFLILPLALTIVPVSMIISQPDLGTAMIILFITAVVFFIAGLSWKFFISLGSMIVISKLSTSSETKPI